MLWSYATLVDDTCFAYSATRKDGTVRIVAERPRDFGFDHAECALPACRWFDVDGFSDQELSDMSVFLTNNAPLIFEMADERAKEAKAVA